MLSKVIHHVKHNPLFSPVLFSIDLLLGIVDWIACLTSSSVSQDKVCLVKLDKIGDYVLVRNFIREFAEELRSSNKTLTVIANNDVRFIAEYLDSRLINWIWIDIYKFSTNLVYRFQLSKLIHKQGFGLAVNPTYARNFSLDDLIIRTTCAPVRIGQVAHKINIKWWERVIGDRFYTRLLRISDDFIFEFERNSLFFGQLLKRNASEIQLEISAQGVQRQIQGEYIVVAPGAGVQFRQWSPSKFADLVIWIGQNTKFKVVLCGSPSEQGLCADIKNQVQERCVVENLAGKLNAAELITVFRDASLAVCNESGSTHISAAIGTETICISNGNHFGKYTEYPKRLRKRIQYIYPFTRDRNSADHYTLSKRYDFESKEDINNISTESVVSLLQATLHAREL